MRIAYITAGAAGMYCGSCLHDNTLAAALQSRGHDVALIPTYTPVRTDETNVSIDRIFYGALNVFLQQQSKLFARLPEPLHWLLDRPALLQWVSKLGASTDARDLGDLTLSVAMGEEGQQSAELERLVGWLRDDLRPEIVHITNSMFLGLAPVLRRELGVPVLCSVQGEDLFLDALAPSYRERVQRVLRGHAREVDMLVATSEYYARHMGEYLDVAPERVRIVKLGIRLDGHGDIQAVTSDQPSDSAPPSIAQPRARPLGADRGADDENDDGRPFVIGYLARICPEKGLHLLIEAFRRLAEAVGPEHVALRFAGYVGKRDASYLSEQLARIASWGLTDRVEHLGEVDREGKIALIESVDVFSVPTVYHESKGLSILEAMASGVPVVQPRHGVFPEVVEATGGGLLVEPDSPEALAEAFLELRSNRARCRALGRAGRVGVAEHHSVDVMTTATESLYREILGLAAETDDISSTASTINTNVARHPVASSSSR